MMENEQRQYASMHPDHMGMRFQSQAGLGGALNGASNQRHGLLSQTMANTKMTLPAGPLSQPNLEEYFLPIPRK